jgi:DNA-binding MarR family transcriptional regulator
VFLVAVPIAAVAFDLSWLLPDSELRKTVHTIDAGSQTETPDPHTSVQEIQVAIEHWARRENRRELYATLAERASVQLDPWSCWLLYRFADHPERALESVATALKVNPYRVEDGLEGLVEMGLVERTTGRGKPHFVLTETGYEASERLLAARQAGITELLGGWDPEAYPEIGATVRQLAHVLQADDTKLLADATVAARTPPSSSDPMSGQDTSATLMSARMIYRQRQRVRQ